MTPDPAALAQYGPYGFGLVSLLIVWYAIVKPQLDRTRVDLDLVKGITDQLSTTSQAVRETAELLNESSVRLERIMRVRDPVDARGN